MENPEVIQQDLLNDEIHPYFQYSHATQGQRFMNFLIDNIVMRFTITYYYRIWCGIYPGIPVS
jgi:hypothetical protein